MVSWDMNEPGENPDYGRLKAKNCATILKDQIKKSTAPLESNGSL